MVNKLHLGRCSPVVASVIMDERRENRHMDCARDSAPMIGPCQYWVMLWVHPVKSLVSLEKRCR